jgi:LacI family transcriptional regulator
MLNGMTDEAKLKGYQLTLFVTNHSKEDALQMVEKVITSHVDGAIIFDDELDVEEVNKMTSYKIPIVVINNTMNADRVACINFGYEHEIRSVIQEYFAKGDKKMYFLHLHHSGRLLQRIERAFVDTHVNAMRGYGIYSIEDSYRQTYADFMEIFKSTRSGYFLAHRDSLAAAVINAAIDSGLKVPEDVEVLSIVGTKYASILRPHISSLHIDLKEVGVKSMQMMTDLLNDVPLDKVHKFESVFVKRDSTQY